MDGALVALGPIEEWNIRPAIQLQLIHFKAAVDRLRAAWRRLPPECRKQVAARFEEMDHGGEDWIWKAVEEMELFPK